MRKNKRNVHNRLHIVALTILLLLSSAPVVCCADEISDAVSSTVNDALQDYSVAVPEEMQGFTDITNIEEGLGIKRILRSVIQALSEESGELGAFLLSIIGIALLFCFASLSPKTMTSHTSRAVAVISSAMLFERTVFILRGVISSLEEVNKFYEAVIPITVTVNSIGASPTSATYQALGMGITLGVYSYICTNILGVFAVAIFLLSALSGLDPIFDRISNGVKKSFLFIIGILSALVGATFSLQGVIASHADTAVVRGARYAISGTVPIVGSAVSGALGVVSGGVGYARTIIGGGSIGVIVTLMLAPLITLFAYRFCLKIGIFLAGVCAVEGCEGVFVPLLSALDVLIAVFSLTCVIYIVELASFLIGGASFA